MHAMNQHIPYDVAIQLFLKTIQSSFETNAAYNH